MARSNKFLNQVKGYSAGNDLTKKQTNATTELVKRLDEENEIEEQSHNLIIKTVNEDQKSEPTKAETPEITTVTENEITDKNGEQKEELNGTNDISDTATEAPNGSQSKVSIINKPDFSNEEYIKTTISIDAVLFNTFKYIAKTNKTTITDYLTELLVEDQQYKKQHPTIMDFTKKIENKKLKNPYQRHYIGLPESLMDFVRKEAFKTQTTVSGYITKIIEKECESKKDLFE